MCGANKNYTIKCRIKEYVYERKFKGYILMAGKTFCGKTRFVQKLTVHNFLGEVKKAEWVSQIELSKS